jgi:hypothetical protein
MMTSKFAALILALSASTLVSGNDISENSLAASNTDNGQVLLIVTREDNAGDRQYDRVWADDTEVSTKTYQLMSDPSVIRVEKDAVVSNSHPTLASSAGGTYLPIVSQAVTGPVLYNDEFFQDQDYFDSENPFSVNLSEAHDRLSFLRTVRVGIIDSGFFDTSDVTFSEGADFVPDPADRDNSFLATDVCADPLSATNHGLHVAQLIGAVPDNGVGIAGAAANVELVAANALDCNNNGSLADTADALRYLANDPDLAGAQSAISSAVDIVNMSFGTDVECPGFLQDAVDFALSQGVLLITEAGDNGNTTATAPANCSGVIAVGSTDVDGQLSSFSNTGNSLDFAAQGEEVRVLNSDGVATTVSGTSYSAAIVSGIFAAALSDRPNTTVAEINELRSRISKNLANPENDSLVGAGLIDAAFLLDELSVARAAAPTQNVLEGDRARFQDVYTHPAVNSFLQVETGGSDACELFEFDGSFSELAANTDQLGIFSVPETEPLNPSNSEADIIDFVSFSERILFNESHVTELDAGLVIAGAYCGLFTGDNCTVRDTVRPIDPASLSAPAICD